MRKDIRRHYRLSFPSVVHLSWQDSGGTCKFATARCIDISISGVRLELPEPVTVRSYVTLRFQKLGFSVNASVRHCVRERGKYIAGIEFSTPLSASDPRMAEMLRRAEQENRPA